MKQIYKIDNQGYMMFGEEKQIDKDELLPTGYIDIPLPKNDEGNQLPFYRPKWNGTEWVEDMAQEEIDALNNQPRELTKEELLEQRVNGQDQVIEELMFVILPELLGGGM